MNREAYYLSLPHDLSGSMSKNRFRIELLWGVSKILDLMEGIEDFSVVFDYACDIEVHNNTSFEFYQIKSHKNNKAYTTSSLTKVKGEGSILGRLYTLKKPELNGKVTLAIVSNVPYSAFSNEGLVSPLVSLPDAEKEKLETALKKELKIGNVDLENILYIQTNMNLENPENEIRGKLVMVFEKIKKCEPSNPNALFRLVFDTVTEKACYEYSCSEYSDVISKKGITKSEFDELLNAHVESAKTGVQAVRNFIDNIKSVSHRKIYKRALAEIVPILSKSKPLKELEKEIAIYLMTENLEGTTEELADSLMEIYQNRFPIEINNSEKMVFSLLIIFKFEEGAYDEYDI